ncbi:hypothetical protein ABXT06_16885 [Flavobacterium sp. UW10123]|uniref:hypothetical protein n=1 Tax=Flavobacterium sp. UW10123 TaxID=3230800 RepID=UPI003395C73A
MTLVDLLFRKPQPKKKYAKLLHVYISRKHSEIIFAPMNREIKIPLYFEQELCEVIDFENTPEIIGESLIRNFDKFELKERKNIHNKKTDWPAFKASKEKTIKGFETNYSLFKIKGANEHNIALIIESVFNLPSQIELTTTISYPCDSSELGHRLLRIYNSYVSKKVE